MTETQAFVFTGAMAVTGMVMGAFLDLTPMGAVRVGAIAMVLVLSMVTRTIGDEDEPEWDR